VQRDKGRFGGERASAGILGKFRLGLYCTMYAGPALDGRVLMSRPIAIVTDGMWRKSLSAIRALGRSGWDVHVLGDSWFTTGFWSRFTGGRHRLPDASDAPEAFGTALLSLLASLSGSSRPVLLPMEDATLTWLARHREAVGRFADFLIPSDEAYAVCADKAATMALAARVGIPHPRTVAADTPDELVAAAASFAPREFIVKPVKGAGSRGLLYNPVLNTVSAAEYLARHGQSVVQERIPAEGDAIGVSLLFDRSGVVVAHFVH